jgi:hypothetical protein
VLQLFKQLFVSGKQFTQNGNRHKDDNSDNSCSAVSFMKLKYSMKEMHFIMHAPATHKV